MSCVFSSIFFFSVLAKTSLLLLSFECRLVVFSIASENKTNIRQETWNFVHTTPEASLNKINTFSPYLKENTTHNHYKYNLVVAKVAEFGNVDVLAASIIRDMTVISSP